MALTTLNWGNTISMANMKLHERYLPDNSQERGLHKAAVDTTKQNGLSTKQTFYERQRIKMQNVKMRQKKGHERQLI